MSVDRRVYNLAARYVEYVWPKIEKRGGVPDTPMNRKERGKGTTAIGEHALEIVMANRIASMYMYEHFEDMEHSWRRARNGVFYSQVLRDIRYDPGDLTNWRAQRTATDKRMMDAFEEVMRQVARGVIYKHGERAVENSLDLDDDHPGKFKVVVHPQDEQQRARTREAQKRDTAWRYQNIFTELNEVQSETGLSRGEAMKVLSEKKRAEGKDLSVRMIRSAQTYVNAIQQAETA